MNSQTSILLYGANGYTGQLIARFAEAYDLKIVLAGRDEQKIKSLAAELNKSFRIFDLNEPERLKKELEGFNIVIHAAGPFSETAKQMIEACLRTKTHYLDINGDIRVFEMIKQYDQAAKDAGIMLLPGAGFDVVPTDCLAQHLLKKMDNITQLELAFANIGGAISHGTAMTMVNKLGKKGAIRKNGKITASPLGKYTRWIAVEDKKFFVMSIPWGDISTASFSTNIPNIIAYSGIKPSIHRWLKIQFLFNWLLRTGLIRNIVRKKIKARPPGPDDEMRQHARAYIWGRVTNGKQEAIASFTCADGYTLTGHSVLVIAKKILQGIFKTGYQTPATAYGEELVREVPGTSGIQDQ
jgi:short subunit dehydrogenase-like uncharacterized protein